MIARAQAQNRRIVRHLRQMLLLAVLLLSPPVHADSEHYLRLAAGDLYSPAFNLAGSLVSAISVPGDEKNCRRPDTCLRAAVDMSTDAPTALNKLRNGAAQLALVPANIVSAAVAAPEGKSLRTLALLDAQPVVIVVRADRSFTNIAALRGARISVGTQRSDQARAMQAVLQAFGLGAGQYQAVGGRDQTDMIARVQRRQVDAAVLPLRAVDGETRTALSSGSIRLLTPGKGEFARARVAMPFLTEARLELDAGTVYSTLALPMALLANEQLEAPVVTTVLERLRLEAQSDSRFAMSTEIALLPAPAHVTAHNFFQSPAESLNAKP